MARECIFKNIFVKKAEELTFSNNNNSLNYIFNYCENDFKNQIVYFRCRASSCETASCVTNTNKKLQNDPLQYLTYKKCFQDLELTLVLN